MSIIRKGLLLGWSPENLSLRMKVEVLDIALSHTTVYKRIADTQQPPAKAGGLVLRTESPDTRQRRVDANLQF